VKLDLLNGYAVSLAKFANEPNQNSQVFTRPVLFYGGRFEHPESTFDLPLVSDLGRFYYIFFVQFLKDFLWDAISPQGG